MPVGASILVYPDEEAILVLLGLFILIMVVELVTYVRRLVI